MNNRILPSGVILEGSCRGPLKKNLFESELKINFFRDSSLGFSTYLRYSTKIQQIKIYQGCFLTVCEHINLQTMWSEKLCQCAGLGKHALYQANLIELVTFVHVRLCNGLKNTFQEEIFIGLFRSVANPLTLNSADNYICSNLSMVAYINKFQH